MKNEEVVMGKMNKKALEDLKRDDPKENNWEIAENEEVRMKNEENVSVAEKQQWPDELKDIFSILPEDMPEIEKMKEKICAAWQKVDPVIRTGNPVWKYSAKENKFVFVFRDGRKVRVEL